MIASGDAYRLQVDAFNPPKPKRLILAYVSQNGLARFFVINTERTELQKTREELKGHLLLMPGGVHDFITHDCWLDCSELIGGWSAAELEDQIAEEPECYLGRLNAHMLRAVKAVVESSRLLSERDKRLILEQWPDLGP